MQWTKVSNDFKYQTIKILQKTSKFSNKNTTKTTFGFTQGKIERGDMLSDTLARKHIFWRLTQKPLFLVVQFSDLNNSEPQFFSSVLAIS